MVSVVGGGWFQEPGGWPLYQDLDVYQSCQVHFPTDSESGLCAENWVPLAYPQWFIVCHPVSNLKHLEAILIFFGPSPASCKAALELEALVFKA